MADKIFSVSKS